MLTRAAHARDLKVIAMSRPVYCTSTMMRRRPVVEVVADTAAVSDALGIEERLGEPGQAEGQWWAVTRNSPVTCPETGLEGNAAGAQSEQRWSP